MRAREFIEQLQRSGRFHFTTREAQDSLNGTAPSVRAQLRRLKEQRLVAEPVRGFHVIVPPEYARLGCLPADQFIDELMARTHEPYYLGLLSAAERHGAAHQRPQSSQVIVRRNRKPIRCGEIRIDFIARHDLELMPIETTNTPRGIVRVATPEVTALELSGYPGHAGGIANVASVLSELAEMLDPDKMADVAPRCPVSWSQRLGWLLEISGDERTTQVLERFVREHARSWTPLRRAAELVGATREPRWKLIVNVCVESEA